MEPDGSMDCSRASGVFRRVITIDTSGNYGRANVVDDYHHFQLEIEIADTRVRSARGSARRTPWSLCPFAARRIKSLAGLDIGASTNVFSDNSVSQNCLHVLELAPLLLAAFRNRIDFRQYEISAPYGDRESEPALLLTDGIEQLRWWRKGMVLTAPSKYAGAKLDQSFVAWATEHLPEPEVEPALILRRGTLLTRGRALNLDAARHSQVALKGGCFVQHADRATSASRVTGSTIDFTDNRSRLLHEAQKWAP